MPIYRFYKLNRMKRVAGPGEDRELDGDRSALVHARGLANGHGIAVWEGKRLVANVEPDSHGGGETMEI